MKGSASSARKHVVPSVHAEVAKVQQEIMAAVEAAGFSDNARFAIRLALDEALANAVRHGNCNDSSKKVTVEYEIDDKQIRISVADEGCGFKPDAIPDCTKNENLTRPSGRGVMLIKSFMTSVSFNARGNCITMIKRRDCELPARKMS